MNERIRLLVEQATTKQEFYPAGCNGYPDYRYEFDKEKFAELIVKECADVVKYYYIRGGEPITPQHIKKHFGVEE